MAIPRETIDRIREAVDIVEVIREAVPDLKKVGKDFRSLCPFHQDKKPSFYVSPSKRIFHCFGCQTGGDVFKFVMRYENVNYPEAVKKLAERAGITVKEIHTEADSERRSIINVLEQAAAFYHRCLMESPGAEQARQYLAGRGLKEDTLRTFLVGYAPSGNRLFEQARKKFKVELLMKTGLIGISDRTGRPYDRMHDRILFPISNAQGGIIAFGGRVIPGGPVKEPRYLNTPETSVFSKSRSLYGLAQANRGLRETKEAVVFEGYMDVIVNHQEGITNSVAPLGTALTEKHLEFLKRFASKVYLVFDPDDSGRSAAVRSGDMCLEMDITSRLVLLPGEDDPDEYVLREGRDSFLNLLKEGLNPVEFKLDHIAQKYDMKQPEGKRDIVRDMLETVKRITDPIIRAEAVRTISSRVSLPEDVILSELRSSIRKKFAPKTGQPSALDSLSVKVRSAEEEIVWLCLHHPELREQVDAGGFTDTRCTRVLPLLSDLGGDEFRFAGILDELDEPTASWLTQLNFEERDYSEPVKTMELLIKDLSSRKQEEKRRELEIEVISMLEGKLTYDESKMQEFNKFS